MSLNFMCWLLKYLCCILYGKPSPFACPLVFPVMPAVPRLRDQQLDNIAYFEMEFRLPITPIVVSCSHTFFPVVEPCYYYYYYYYYYYNLVAVNITAGVDFDIVWASATADFIKVSDVHVTSGAPDIRPLDLFGTFSNEESEATRFKFDMRSRID